MQLQDRCATPPEVETVEMMVPVVLMMLALALMAPIARMLFQYQAYT